MDNGKGHQLWIVLTGWANRDGGENRCVSLIICFSFSYEHNLVQASSKQPKGKFSSVIMPKREYYLEEHCQ